ncbi:hypothetical protein ACRAWF_29005 [Streptomyces sp. L7]
MERPPSASAPIRWLNRAFGKLVMTSAATQEPGEPTEPASAASTSSSITPTRCCLFFKAFEGEKSRTGYYRRASEWALILGNPGRDLHLNR